MSKGPCSRLPLRDVAAISHAERAEQGDGTICYFFGDTTIQAEETVANGKLHLTPISGNQVGPDGWVDLEIERVRGYCALLELQLNQ